MGHRTRRIAMFEQAAAELLMSNGRIGGKAQCRLEAGHCVQRALDVVVRPAEDGMPFRLAGIDRHCAAHLPDRLIAAAGRQQQHAEAEAGRRERWICGNGLTVTPCGLLIGAAVLQCRAEIGQGFRVPRFDFQYPAAAACRVLDAAGIKEGDIVIEFDNVPIRTRGELLSRVKRAIPYSTIKVVVMRGKERLEIPVKMGRQ